MRSALQFGLRRRRRRSASGAATLFDPAVYGVDALSNKYAVLGVARLLTSWTGSLIRLVRSTDSAQSDFGYDPVTGFIPAAEVTSWLGGGTANVVTLYDQTGNSRDYTQATAAARPTLNLAGAFPVLQFDGADRLLCTTPMADFARNRGNASLVAVGKMIAKAANQSLFACSALSGTNIRIAISRTAADAFALHGKRLDGDAASTSDTIAGDDNPHVFIGRADYANSDGYFDVDASAIVDTTWAGAGTTSDTAAALAGIGACGAVNIVANGSTFSAGIAVQGLISDAERTALITSLAPLKL